MLIRGPQGPQGCSRRPEGVPGLMSSTGSVTINKNVSYLEILDWNPSDEKIDEIATKRPYYLVDLLQELKKLSYEERLKLITEKIKELKELNSQLIDNTNKAIVTQNHE